MNTPSTLASQIYAIAHLTGSFELRSGVTSNEYFDKYRFEASPALLKEICDQLIQKIPQDTEVLAGLEMGGIPIVTLLSQLSGLPCLFVRKQAKAYGTKKFAEGSDYVGKRCLIVEDVVTSGGQIVMSTTDLRDTGAIVTDAICVIDRQAGGTENLLEAGIQLHALLTMDDLTG